MKGKLTDVIAAVPGLENVSGKPGTLKNGSGSRRESSPKVALLFESPNAYARGILVGIGEYILSHGPWRVYLSQFGVNDPPPAWLSAWDGQGIIVRGENKLMAVAVAKLSMPVIDMTPSRLLPTVPWVKSDDAAVARLAAQHFFERSFRHFAFCGDARLNVSNRRCEHFQACLSNHGYSCHVFKSQNGPRDGDTETDAIGRWLADLPKPVAVFAFNDGRGQQVLDGCRRTGLAVPEQVAVLGVDNDEVLCALSPPPMSSVILNPHRGGWEAATLLTQMMNGKNIPSSAHLIPPVGVAVRQSTDVLAVDDPQIARALRYIREHACERIGVGNVLQHCPMARRTLEQRFKKLLGRTPRQEIVRVQLNRVKELLIRTELPVAEIADRAGFEPEYLSVVFKQETGLTPTSFRNKNGLRR
ncbi:MAG: DNA-binding transcriptional regulator [Akkermansiaceae bacterium]|nr:DNA-binding transcriptional regulator [Verrucomicrobiales bacterium]